MCDRVQQIDSESIVVPSIVRGSVELHSEPAGQHDIEQIEQLLSQHSPQCLPLDSDMIGRHLHHFRVIRNGDLVVANAALQPIDGRRHELRSVAVAPGWERLGLGSSMVSWAQDEARARQLTLLCVTTSRRFFSRHGFERVPLERAPEKPARRRWPLDEERVAMQWQPDDLGPRGARQ
jgi:N-acetylglutamate synthase-like GNAT family acetyltransferase